MSDTCTCLFAFCFFNQMKLPRSPLIVVVVVVASSLLLLPTFTMANKVWRLGPIRLFPGGYAWQASVDRATGLAAAQELSTFRLSLSQQQQQQSPLLPHILGNYPAWLCRGTVTLGLLRAVRQQPGGSTRLETRLLGLPILTFGRARGQKIAIRTATTRQQAIEWKYPIQGGGGLLLAAAAAAGGNLVVTLRPKAGANKDDSVVVLDTQLVAYRPALVGTTAQQPANPLRIAFYLSTQSVIHGYAMWRFHRFVRHELQKEYIKK